MQSLRGITRAWLLLLGIGAGCSFPIDDYAVRPVGDSAAADVGTDAGALDSAVTHGETSVTPEDTSITDTAVTPTDSSSPADTVSESAPDAATCVCTNCNGGHKCKTYEPAGCGPANGPC